MITNIEIENYKSIEKLSLELGRTNVFIGENGAGKSNILEVIALAGAAAAEKLDNEFLASRGIRVTKPEHMRPAFPGNDPVAPIIIKVDTNAPSQTSFMLENDNTPYAKWRAKVRGTTSNIDVLSLRDTLKEVFEQRETFGEKHLEDFDNFIAILLSSFSEAEPVKNGNPKEKYLRTQFELPSNKVTDYFAKALSKRTIAHSELSKDLGSFVIYSPENSSLRNFEREGQIEPLGINGEGVLRLLTYYVGEENKVTFNDVRESLKLFNWFDGFEASQSLGENQLLVSDRFLDASVRDFDYKSTNEGFFFLLFYFLLFHSSLTPRFFAIDNIDASLNPKLCERLVKELTRLAKLHDKQSILTTHNPAVLDGLNLNDDEQRLFVISRGRNGKNKIKRIFKPEPVDGQRPLRLSELFIRGMIGGLPKGF